MLSSDEYQQHDAVGLAGLIRNGDASASEVLECAISRAETVNPAINAIAEKLYDSARDTARRCSSTAPFAGVPWIVKDLGAPIKGVRLTSGSRLFRDFVSEHDCELVLRHKSAGLNIFCTSTTPEFGSAATTESVLFGPTRNPWSLELTAGGSSGGAAALVAAGVVPAAHASDSGGSIRVPASCCGVLGLKPSRGRVPVGFRKTEQKLGMTASHAVTRSVRDMGALLDATHGLEPGARYTAPAPGGSFQSACERPPNRLRIALQLEPFSGCAVDPECKQAAVAAARLCEELGHFVEEAQPILDGALLGKAFFAIGCADVLNTLSEARTALGARFDTSMLEEVTASLFTQAESISASGLIAADGVLQRAAIAMSEFQSDYDVILTPGLGQLPQPLGVLALSQPAEQWMSAMIPFSPFTSIYNQTGQPAIMVPLYESTTGLPIGVQFGARLGEEEVLLSLSAQLEGALPWAQRRPPMYAST